MIAVLKKQKDRQPVGFRFGTQRVSKIEKAMRAMCYLPVEYDLYTDRHAPPGQYRRVKVEKNEIKLWET